MSRLREFPVSVISMTPGIKASTDLLGCGGPRLAWTPHWRLRAYDSEQASSQRPTYCRPVVVGCVKSGGQAVSVGAQQVLEGEPAGNVP